MSKKQNKDMKKFHLGDILGVMTGVTCLPNGFGGICDLLTFMVGESPYTTQAGRFAEEVRPYLNEQFPQFSEITPDQLKGNKHEQAMDALITQFGAFHEVRKIHPEDHEIIDPMVEFKRDFPNIQVTSMEITQDEDKE